ncbi:MAG TPA: RING finger domain-containing protein [Candidatus Saccharimonadales bacterium]|nr:RING finger domain-containing protein [Candidatus Saccharimonadales bacterium]
MDTSYQEYIQKYYNRPSSKILYQDVEHKYQDYTTLLNLYGQSNKIVLTNNPDIDYQILLNLDIDNLNNFCFTNKYISQFCNDENFWVNKIKNDQLPNIFLFQNPQSEFERHNLPTDINFKKPTSSTDWIKYYKNLNLAYQYANYTFKIVDFESTKNKQNFIFYVTFANNDLNLFLYIVKQMNFKFKQEFIKNYMKQMKMFTDECSICLTEVEELDYHIFKCKHGHHKQCVNQLRKMRCPVCRAENINMYPISITVFKSINRIQQYVISLYISENVGAYYYTQKNIIYFLTLLYMLNIYYPDSITIHDKSKTPYIPSISHTSDAATRRKEMIETFRYLNI